MLKLVCSLIAFFPPEMWRYFWICLHTSTNIFFFFLPHGHFYHIYTHSFQTYPDVFQSLHFLSYLVESSNLFSVPTFPSPQLFSCVCLHLPLPGHGVVSLLWCVSRGYCKDTAFSSTYTWRVSFLFTGGEVQEAFISF